MMTTKYTHAHFRRPCLGVVAGGFFFALCHVPLNAVESGSTQKTEAASPNATMVNIDQPEPVDLKDLVKIYSKWFNKNIVLDSNISGKIQIISPAKVTLDEAYQALLSALDAAGFTTIETGQIVKIIKKATAVRGELKTFTGASSPPRTDQMITQIVPLQYVEAKGIKTILGPMVATEALLVYEPTNSLIITESANVIRKIIDVLALVDRKTDDLKVEFLPLRYREAKEVLNQLNDLLKTQPGAASHYKLLADERRNLLVYTGPMKYLTLVQDYLKQVDTASRTAKPGARIFLRPLEFTDAKKMATTLAGLRSGKSDQLKITADETSNSLLISGSEYAFKALNSVILKLDYMRLQVFFEVDILSISEDQGFKFAGSIFAGAGKKDGTGDKFITGWQARDAGGLITAGSAGQGGAANATKVAESFKDDFTFGVMTGDRVKVEGLGVFSPVALIKLIKTDRYTKVLSSPYVLTSDNEESSIAIGSTVFINSSEVGADGVIKGKVNKEKVDLSLRMTPKMSISNYLTLKVELDNNSILGSEGGLPKLATSKFKQSFSVKNGQTIVISGLEEASVQETTKKIPILGDIPIVGQLFKSNTKSRTRTYLTVFVTPHIINTSNDLLDLFKERVAMKKDFETSMLGMRNDIDISGATGSRFDMHEQENSKQRRQDAYREMGYPSDESLQQAQ